MISEQDLAKCGTMALVADRSEITAALAAVNVMRQTPEEPNGWRDALKAFENEPRAKYLLAVADTLEAMENCTPRTYLCADDETLDIALLTGCKNLTGDTFWMVYGSEMTQARIAKKIKHPLRKWE